MTALNPRVQLWLTYRGLVAADVLNRSSTGGLRTVVDTEDEQRRELPWTLVYGFWVQARWREWARELGFRGKGGGLPHQEALLAGHTATEFDAWLAEWVRTTPVPT